MPTTVRPIPPAGPAAPPPGAPGSEQAPAAQQGAQKPKGLFEALGDLFKSILGAFGIPVGGQNQDLFQRGPDAAQQGIRRNQVPPNPRPQLQPPT